MWRDKAAPPTHAMHGGFGIGAVLIPLLVNPLLAVTRTDLVNQTIPNIIVANHSISNIVISNQSSPLFTEANQGRANVSLTDHSVLVSNQPLRIGTQDFLAAESTVTYTYPKYAERDEADTYSTIGRNKSGQLSTARSRATATSEIKVIKETRIFLAFLTVGLITFTSAVPFYIFQYLKYKHRNNNIHKPENIVKPRTFREIINPSTYTDGNLRYGIGMFILLFVFYGNVVGGEQMFGLFVRSFSVDSLGFSKDDASYLNMLYWLGFTVARMLFTGLAHFIHIKYLISIEVILLLASVTVLDVLGAKTPLILWIFTALQGLLFAPLFPSGISYANTMMDVSGVCITVIVLASGVGDLLYSSLAGTFYDIIGPRAVVYAMQVSGALIFIAVVLMRIISYRRKERYTTKVEELSIGEEIPKVGVGEMKPFMKQDGENQ